MERLRVYQLKEGMVLAEPVFGPDGKVLLNEGTRLNYDLIKRLTEMEIVEAAVNEESTAAIDPGEVLTGRVKHHVKRVLNVFYPLDIAGKQLNQVRQRHSIVSEVLDEVVENPEVHSFFLDLRTIDDYLLEHSANVCVLSLIVGAAMDLFKSDLVKLGTGAILHDIGNKNLPRELFCKVGEYTTEENELIKEHTKFGYQTLRERGFEPLIARVALYHHERWDGSGYPNKLKQNKIDFFSRIVSVADVYDALTAKRAYRKEYLPHEAIEYLYGAGNFYFDAKVVKAFVQSVAPYPLGSIVQLSTGETGIVVNIAKTVAPRPIVKICYDKDNKKLEFPRQVDLSEEKTLFITKIL